MKQLTRKLFLSICTLAICAVTLVSTTFAWYTSSKEVTAEKITVSSSTATDSDLTVALYDPAKNSYGPFTNYIDFNIGEISLKPLHYNNGVYVDQSGATVAASTGSYLEFKLLFRTKATPNGSIPVYFQKFELTSSGAKEFDNIVHNTPDVTPEMSGLNQATYIVDMLKATNMVITVNKTTTNTTIFELDNYAIQTEKGIGTANAYGYYNAVMPVDLGTKPTYTTVTLQKNEEDMNAIFDFTELKDSNTAYVDVEVVFGFYLDGWDNYCYDGCKGQSFKLTLEFSTIKPTTGE